MAKRDYDEYFKEIEEGINNIIKRSNKYADIIDKEIDSLLAHREARGVQHQMATHMTNAVTLMSSMQTAYDKKYKLKDRILEHERKDAATGEDDVNIVELFEELKTEVLSASRKLDKIEKTEEEYEAEMSAALLDYDPEKA